VQKIRLTGGEPTVRKDLQEIVQRLSTLKPLGLQTIAMTSNGIALGRQLPGLVAAGLSLNGLNISLDSLRPERFERLTRRWGHARVLQSIQQAVDMGFDPVKVSRRVYWSTAVRQGCMDCCCCLCVFVCACMGLTLWR
jgi:cyclic pyranopterin phosphate synthase